MAYHWYFSSFNERNVNNRKYESDLQAKENRLLYYKSVNRFIVGSDYSLFNKRVDGFEQTERIYKCFGYISKLNGIDIDSVIMKQINGEESTIFSLTRDDCNILKINYEQGLCLFPSNMNWQLPSYEKEKLQKQIEERDKELKRKKEEQKKREAEIKKQQEELRKKVDEDIINFKARNLGRILLSQEIYRKYLGT